MSEADWCAVLIEGAQMTIWPVTDDTFGTAEIKPTETLDQLLGPLLVAGLEVTPRNVPARPADTTTHAPGLPNVAAISLLWQDNPPALSRGAETALAGYVGTHTQYDGVLLVLGAEETLWAHISAEEVVSFQTFLTPMMMRGFPTAQSQGDAFEKALSDTLSRPERLAQHLASARASQSGQEAAHLIGAEIAAAKPYWLGQQVTILADDTQAVPYLRALQAQGVSADAASRTDALHHGFKTIWTSITQ